MLTASEAQKWQHFRPRQSVDITGTLPRFVKVMVTGLPQRGTISTVLSRQTRRS